ncbi:MAG TPA: hypothetical protein VNR65_07710 [Geobacterales bacterium]|nr:hypothetical protein [Geobacterales bacterium]
MQSIQYTLQVLEAYEDEVAGAAYFDGLALAYPQQSAFFERCAALERETATQLSALLQKYQLTPRAQTTLEERGALDARKDAGSDWKRLMQQSIKSYARYVTEFKALEAMGPVEDQHILAALTAHEIQLIEWMQAETGSAATSG